MTSPMPTADTSDLAPREPSSPSAGRGRRLARFMLVPGLLVTALIAASCSSPPSATSSADTLITQGLNAESHGQTQQALNDFSAALKKDPANAVGYYDLGVVYQEYLNNPTQAATEYNKALLVNPHYKPAMYNLATLEATSNPQGAMALYTQLLKINPKQSNVLFNLGLLQVAQSDAATQLQGHANLKQAITLDPTLATRVPKGITP